MRARARAAILRPVSRSFVTASAICVGAGCQLVSGLADVDLVDTPGGGGAPATTGVTTSSAASAGGSHPEGGGGAGGEAAGGGGAGGGEPVPILIHDFGEALADCVLAQNDTSVFFTDALLGEDDARIWRAEKIGAPSAVPLITGEAAPRTLWATETDIYWAEYDGMVIRRAPLAMPQDKENVVSGVATRHLQVDGSGTLFWSGALGLFRSGSPSALVAGSATHLDARQPDHVFVDVGRQVLRVPKTGGAGEPTLTASYYFSAVVTDATYVFGSDAAAGTLLRAPHDGGGSVVILTTPGTFMLDVAVDPASNDVYVGTGDGAGQGQLLRVGKDGGASTPLDAGAEVSRLLVDDTHVTWCDAPNGTIWRTPR